METEIVVTGYLIAVFLPALAGILLGIFSKSNKIANLIAGLCIISCIAGATTYPLWYLGYDLSYTVPISSAIGEYILVIDQLTALMITMSSMIFMLVVIHVVKSVSDSGTRYSGLLNVLFISCFTCMSAGSVITLLLSWELITLTTFLLSKRGNNEKARWLFFVIAHIGGMLLICAFSYIWSVTGTQIFSEWNGLSAVLGPGTSMALILMIVIGFGAKLGLIPFHAWMPGLYASAPIHTTTLLSTVCSNVAILVLVKSIFSYIGVLPSMYPVAFLIMAIAVITALWGAMESLVQDEPRKILSFSSMENMALVILCLSLGMVYINESVPFAKLVLIAAVLHTMNHAVFKSLMLMTVDTVEDYTGEKKIWRMGGLAKTLPLLSVVALIGVLSMAAIPPTNGFVSEWMMIQSLMGSGLESKGMSLLMPLVLAAVGLCGMMMAASYARFYGFIFLGRPRSEKMQEPRPMKKGTVLPLIVLAVLCMGMGVFAMGIMDMLSSGIGALAGMPADPSYRTAMSVDSLPLVLGISIAAVLAIVYWAYSRVKRPVRYTKTWGCGGNLDENMQYSSIGYSQPLVKVFHPFYGDTTTVIETDDKNKKTIATEFKEPFMKYIYKPIANGIKGISERIGKMQDGSIQTYFAYILITLVIVLLATRLL
ncbi:MAG TPA: proton-conducting transporter membrane subunit [Candidatus Methanomethylophilaceae archaeon]|nr:proton-conducting transporter membrane subunit [Candidatus Methanomethylophilaceae archaeon]